LGEGQLQMVATQVPDGRRIELLRSPSQPGLAVADLIEQDLPISIVEPVPVSRDQMARAHERSYVDGVLACVLPNGFRGRQKDVADSLPWTSGSFLSAGRPLLGRSAASRVTVISNKASQKTEIRYFANNH
jgi:hypothetical protein